MHISPSQRGMAIPPSPLYSHPELCLPQVAYDFCLCVRLPSFQDLNYAHCVNKVNRWTNAWFNEKMDYSSTATVEILYLGACSSSVAIISEPRAEIF